MDSIHGVWYFAIHDDDGAERCKWINMNDMGSECARRKKSGPSGEKKFCINFNNFFVFAMLNPRSRPGLPVSARMKAVKRSLMLFHIYHPRNHNIIIFSLVCSRRAIVCIDNDDLLCSLAKKKPNPCFSMLWHYTSSGRKNDSFIEASN